MAISTNKLNASELDAGLKQVILDYTYPIGSYFITENKAFNTI